jgi:glycosyltransferase involved in cell wall biosynthesis
MAQISKALEYMGSLRICLLTSDFLPNIGGVAAHTYELAKALSKLRHKVIVIHLVNDVADDYEEVVAGFKVYRMHFQTHRLLPVRLCRLLRLARRVDALMSQHDTQILHWHTIRPSGLVTRLVRRSGILKVFTNHTSGYLEMIETPLGRLKAQFHLGHAESIIAPSRELARASFILGISSSRVYFIPNGVDIERFHPGSPDSNLRHRLGVAPGKSIIICPRRLVLKNGVRYLAYAVPMIVKAFDSVHFLILGDGQDEEVEYIQKILDRENVNSYVTLTGPIPNSRMPELYRLADIAVLPSLVEATSIAGLEAMASSCPLVGTEVGGIPSLIQDGKTGYLVPPRNPKSIAEAILKLLRDEEQRIRMGQAARKRVEVNFSWQVIAQQTVKVYEALKEYNPEGKR